MCSAQDDKRSTAHAFSGTNVDETPRVESLPAEEWGEIVLQVIMMSKPLRVADVDVHVETQILANRKRLQLSYEVVKERL